MLHVGQIHQYLRGKCLQASEVTVENQFRIPGGASREIWPLDARWREGGGIHERLVFGQHARTELSGLADSVGSN